mgnify:CR=1 FL=1|tara:strand:- start:1361 stop:1873 length:513 start_codon:yes stop_codon:yes gene_type:complete
MMAIQENFMSENPHKLFINNAKNSIGAVMFVAEWAVLKGFDVEIKGMKFAKNYGEWKSCADDGFDLTIINDSGVRKTINVKKNRKSFSSVNDFTSNFKYFERPILVSATHVNTPDITLILSSDYNGAIKIKKETKEFWGIRKNVFDARYNTTQDCFDVSNDHVEWVNFKD